MQADLDLDYAPDWKERTRERVQAQANLAFVYAMPSLRDAADRMRLEGCFICGDPLSQCETPADCGIAKPESAR